MICSIHWMPDSPIRSGTGLSGMTRDYRHFDWSECNERNGEISAFQISRLRCASLEMTVDAGLRRHDNSESIHIKAPTVREGIGSERTALNPLTDVRGLESTDEKKSFPDTEFAEDDVEDIVGDDFAADTAEVVQGFAQV